jgi:hypothetical protein
MAPPIRSRQRPFHIITTFWIRVYFTRAICDFYYISKLINKVNKNTSRFAHCTAYCDYMFVIPFAGRPKCLQFYVALICCLQRAGCKCRRTQHVTAAHTENYFKYQVNGRSKYLRRRWFIVYNAGYFLPSRCSWLKTQNSAENLSLTMKSREYQASFVVSFWFSQYLSRETDSCIRQLKTGEVYFKNFGVIIKTSMGTKVYPSTVPVGPWSTQKLIWKLATRIASLKHIASS